MSGLSTAGRQLIHEAVAAHVGPDSVPGAVCLVACGDDVQVEALGHLTIGGAGAQRDSLFRIASMTKPITGAATMALVDEGLLDLHEPIGRLLPELASPRVLRTMDGPLDDTVAAQREITVRDLLTFTNGFGHDAAMFGGPTWPIVTAGMQANLGTFGPPDPSAQPGPDEWMARLGALPLMAQPGARWLYNAGAQVLGVLCQRAADTERLEDVLRTRIFEPLGMTQTSFVASDPARLATAYVGAPAGLAVWDEPDGKWASAPAFEDGAAGLVSTVDDMLAFGRMFLRHGTPVLSADAVKEMSCDQLTPAQRQGQEAFLHGRSWGLCQSVIISGERAGAFGWDGGLGTSFLVDPSRDLVVVVLTQRLFDSPEPPAVHGAVQDAAYAAVS
ncbi:MAG TPA: serine hydrolase domain-containing protein [Acidimicrobiales bacterium]